MVKSLFCYLERGTKSMFIMFWRNQMGHFHPLAMIKVLCLHQVSLVIELLQRQVKTSQTFLPKRCSDQPNIRFGQTSTVQFGPNDKTFFLQNTELFSLLNIRKSFVIFIYRNILMEFKGYSLSFLCEWFYSVQFAKQNFN